MTVRTWLTISGLALAALTAAFVTRVVMPMRAPALLASIGTVRLTGVKLESCWPQRNGRLRCERTPDRPHSLPGGPAAPTTGTLRIVAAYPVQPTGGTVSVQRGGDPPAIDRSWTSALRYSLSPGRYVVNANAAYAAGATIRYEFLFTVR